MPRIPELTARTDGGNAIFQVSGDTSATVASAPIPRYEPQWAALRAGFQQWAAGAAKDATRYQRTAWDEAQRDTVANYIASQWRAMQAAVQAGAREDAKRAAQPIPDGAHGPEDRAHLRALSVPDQIRAVAAGDDDMLAALLHVGAARWNWPVEAWSAAVERWQVRQVLARTGIPAQFAIQPSVDDVAPIGVDWKAAETAARAEIARDGEHVAQTARAKRVLTDTVAAVAAGCGMTAAEALALLMGEEL